MSLLTIRALRPEEAAECEQILRSLPGWFGIEKSIQAYARDLAAEETYVALLAEEVAGFLTLKTHDPRSAEIHVMAVREEHHAHGIGRRLVEHAERLLHERGIEFLQVKTLGPSCPNAEYERTRGFYRRVGFVPLEEHHLWGKQTPCLVLVKHLPSAGAR